MSEAGCPSGPHGGGGKTSGKPRGRPRGSKNKNPRESSNTCGPNIPATDANSNRGFQLRASSQSLLSNTVMDDSSTMHQAIPIPLKSANSGKRLASTMIQENQRINNQRQRHHPPLHKPNMGSTFNVGGCLHRLMEYLHAIRSRPRENTIEYWRHFVNRYYAPQAKLKWCLSSYGNPGIFPQSDEMLLRGCCNLCGSRSGDGFEAAVGLLPIINQIQAHHGMIEEYAFVGTPKERQLSSGIIVLKYEEVVQKTTCKQLTVVRNGKLQIAFTPELKILTWEFCPRRHEVFSNRGSISSEAEQLQLISDMYEDSLTESGSSGLSDKELKATLNMFLATIKQLAKNLEPGALNYWGFSKAFVHHLQTSRVLRSMKDLMGISLECKMRAVENFYSNLQQATAESRTQQMQAEQNYPNRAVAVQPGMGTSFNFNNNPQNSINNDRAHPATIPGSNSVNNNNVPSRPCSDNEQRVIQMLVQELHNNKEEALQQQVGVPLNVDGSQQNHRIRT